MKKVVTLFALLLLAVSSSCSEPKQYGVDILKLDSFDFSLNIESFFQDESIFRGNNKKGFLVSTSENVIRLDSANVEYITYSTTSASRSRPLASYNGINFEWLSVIADGTDENVLMVVGSSFYTKPEEMIKMIDGLKAEYGVNAVIKDQSAGVNLIFTKGDLVANLFISLNSRRDRSGFVVLKNDTQFGSEEYNNLKSELDKQEKIECSLFITNSAFDKALLAARNYSGRLMYYN